MRPPSAAGVCASIRIVRQAARLESGDFGALWGRLPAPYHAGKETHMPTTSRITSKAQVTVPRVVRNSLNLGPGDEIEWERAGSEFRVRKVSRRRRSPIRKWIGYAKELDGVDIDAMVDQMRGR
jgi:AbrB family looped-hinge helix DNA binding protein